jgi:ADP-heptose:LPS heptosyltransferase
MNGTTQGLDSRLRGGRPPDGIERIAVFRALQLGDMLCAVPALRALRRAYPQARITLIGLPWAHTFVERYGALIDELMVFPGAIGFPEQAETDEHLAAFTALARARRFDLALQLHGSGGIANDIVAAFGGRLNAGFTKPGERARAGIFIRWPDDLPEPLRYNALLGALGVGAIDPSLDIPLDTHDESECDAVIRAYHIEPDRLVLLHPGAQLPSRRWPAERFAAVADQLVADGWQIGITGTAGELALTSSVLGAMSSGALHLAGRTTLGGLAALLARAQLVVCNDTGISHVAAAVRTRSVVIASGSDTRRWAPLDTRRHRVLADYPPCRPCDFRVCPYEHECAMNVSVARVVDIARAQLRDVASARAGAPFTLRSPRDYSDHGQ